VEFAPLFGADHETRELDDMMTKMSPLVYLLVAILLAVALHLLLPFRELMPFPWRLVGLLPLLLGIILNVFADRSLKRHETTIKPFALSRALVTDGVYRVSRHPMYLGMILIIAGIAVLLGSLGAWLTLPLLATLLDLSFIRIEERMLEETFGQAYRSYRRQARRWL
jgi:protein-S-isoprenylcysteine O-methyltransferase Ste14